MIREIANKINELSKIYEIGKLQNIRTEIKKLKRRPGSDIFDHSTIDKNDKWAFHYGGRKELQFNIGLEEEGFRYGLALSLEASHTLPDISILYPKAKRLNQFIRQYPDFFSDYKMWHYQENGRSNIYPVKPISEDLLKLHTFIFIGKLLPENKIDYDEVLKTYDELLKPYVFVEKNVNSEIIEYGMNEDNAFNFELKTRKLPRKRDYTIEEKSINLAVRHTLVQEKLIQILCEKYGADNVSPEHPISGKKIDVVLKNGKTIVFYEVKICGSAKACIREALGQLMEYSYWPNRKNADLLVVVGEEEIDSKTAKYLKYLNSVFSLPIQYESISIN
ncbi:hypothetical protein CHISP_0890 [Chitinispirillum alkaliphilum]|nr:hypothetical protein CHISP_0890 [Chitinispirillum alkaliphilum]